MNGTRRTIARLAVVLAVTLVLAGLGAEVAKADHKIPDHHTAGNFKVLCEEFGGSFSHDGLGNTECHFKDGSWTECDANGNDCWFTPAPKVSEPAPNRGVGGVVDEGGVLDGGGPATDLNGGVGGGVPAGEAEA